jgi:inner membrane protein
MARALWLKISAIVGLAVALLIPLKLIESKIEERQATRASVVAELANTSVGEQTMSGPLLILPCTEHYEVEERDPARGLVREKRSRDCTRTYVADSLTMTGALKTENRHRGIYSARFFAATLQIEGRFELPAIAAPSDVMRVWGAPLLALGVRDVRGIRSAAGISWDGNAYPFTPGLKPGAGGAGVHAVLGAPAVPRAGAHAFSFAIEIAGLQNLNFVPSARQHEVRLTADWPHPSFVGRHLPVTRDIGTEGFQAMWRISELASEAPRTLAACADASCKALEQLHFGVSLLDPVDVYAQANRAVKYALLFVLLTFAVFFLFEIMRELRIHPVQYGLVGLALAVFFLLLIALSEHIRFVYAYLISAGACVALIAAYVQAVLRSRLRALGFAAMLTALYTMLYALLRSEDHSLLLGALLVFGVLAAIMMLTRKVDWYGVGRAQHAGSVPG